MPEAIMLSENSNEAMNNFLRGASSFCVGESIRLDQLRSQRTNASTVNVARIEDE
jgi:hypothetical protein